MRLSGNLWRHGDFLRLWLADTVSQLTRQVTGLALPTVAVLLLDVTPLQMGILSALEFLAFPLLGLFVGVWADRFGRKPMLVVSNLVRMATLATVPAAYVAHLLSLYQLYAVALVMGVGGVFFEITYQAYLPSLIDKKDLVEGNTKLTASGSFAQASGQGLAGLLMTVFGAALSVGADVAGFLVSAVALASIRKKEPRQERAREDFFLEMKEGAKVVLGNKTLWSIAGCSATANLGGNMAYTMLLIFAYRSLGLTTSVIWIPFMVGIAGVALGAIAAGGITRRLGLGHAIAAGAMGKFFLLLIPLASYGLPLVVLAASQFLTAFFLPVYNINQVSLRQAMTPDRLQGRMNATMRTIVWGTIPVGAVLGGLAGNAVGVVPTIIAGGVLGGSAFLWVVLGPVFGLRGQPAELL
ncbi:MAG: MFS transporter [Nitrososphaerota archaeon]|nr:MFS transporter [Nitrososphaerota archaeon]